MIYIKNICKLKKRLIVEKQVYNEQSLYKFEGVTHLPWVHLYLIYISRSFHSLLESLSCNHST